MQKQISSRVVALTFGVLVVSFLAAFYVIAWQEPTQAPPGGNVPAPLNVGNVGQAKEGGLILNTGGAENALIIDQGNLCFGADCRSSWPVSSWPPSWVIYKTQLTYTGNLGGINGANTKCDTDPDKPAGYNGYFWKNESAAAGKLAIKSDGTTYTPNANVSFSETSAVPVSQNTLLWGGDKCGGWTSEAGSETYFVGNFSWFAHKDIGGGIVGTLIIQGSVVDPFPDSMPCSAKLSLYCVGFK